MIAAGDDSLTKICARLQMAPSTISKHLHDLEETGVIHQREDNHLKKWKYYELASAPVSQKIWMPNAGFLTTKRPSVVAGAGVAAVLIVAYALFYLSQQNAYTYVPISLTDPPQVPAGTQALYINYSSLSILAMSHGSYEWIPTNASGSINLLGLVNTSQIIGDVGLSPNAAVKAVRFNISSGEIVVDNITYPVYMVDRQITASIGSNARINSSSDIMLDFSPTVTTAYDQNTTLFVMLPSLQAVMVSAGRFDTRLKSGNISYLQERHPLPPSLLALFGKNNTSIKITNISLSTSAGVTRLNITMENTGKTNTTVFGMALMGLGALYGASNEIAVDNGIIEKADNSTISINTTKLCNLGDGHRPIIIDAPRDKVDILVCGFGDNASAALIRARLYSAITELGPMQLNFITNHNNRTLALLFQSDRPSGNNGYVIPAGSSITFRYTGTLPSGLEKTLNNSNMSNLSVAVLTNEGVYRSDMLGG